MLGFLRSTSSSSLNGSASAAAAASADPDSSASLDLSLGASSSGDVDDRSDNDDDNDDDDDGDADGDADDQGDLSLPSEDGDLSAFASHATVSKSSSHGSLPRSPPSASNSLTPGGVLGAVRDQHPNLSVFRPSFTDRLASPRTDSPSQAAGPASASRLPASLSSSASSATSPATSSRGSLPDSDLPSVKALQSKQVFMLKPKKRRPASPPEASTEVSSGTTTASSGFLIQGLNPSPAITEDSSAGRRVSSPSSSWPTTTTPAVDRIRAEARPATPLGSGGSPSLARTPDASVRGILRLPRTPGTGSSVRFGKRLYDDGDESAMSVSAEASPEQHRSPGTSNATETDQQRAARIEDEADVEWSLSVGSPQRRDTPGGHGNGASLTSSPHAQLSLSSLNDSPDHDQIRALRDLSTSTEGDDSSASFNDSSDSGSQINKSRLPSSSPTVRIPAPRAMPPSPLGRDASPFMEGPGRGMPSDALDGNDRHESSESRLTGLSAAFDDQTNEASNLFDLSMDSMRRMDDTRSLANIDAVRTAGRALRSPRLGDVSPPLREPKSSLDSMPSSISYDSSEASFSESFLREAGAEMLAGLDFDYVESASTSSREAGAEAGEEAHAGEDQMAAAAPEEGSHDIHPADEDMPLETPRPTRFAQQLKEAQDDSLPTLLPLEEATNAEAEAEAVDSETEPAVVTIATLEQDEADDENLSREQQLVDSPAAQRDTAPHDAESPMSSSPHKHSDFSLPNTTPSQPSIEAAPISPAKDGGAPRMPSPETPASAARVEALSRLTPGNLSIATTAAEWATPQWTGPTSVRHSANGSEDSVDRSLSSSAIASSPTREKLARKIGELGSRSPSAGQMVLRPGRLTNDGTCSTHDQRESAADSATSDLEEIVAVIQQLDQAHTEHGSYLVSRVQQAESKFSLLSQALKQETRDKERIARENDVARSKIQLLQETVDTILREHEVTKQQNQAKDDEVEKLVLKLNSQLERRQRDKDWQVRCEELQRQLDEETRARAVERQDWEVRLSCAHRSQGTPADANAASGPTTGTMDHEERQRLIQEVREQTRDSCRRDFEIRSEIAQRQSQQDFERLQAALEAAKLQTSASDLEAERQQWQLQHHEEAAAQAQATEGMRLELEALREDLHRESDRHAERVSHLEDQLHEARQEVQELEQQVSTSKDGQTKADDRAVALESELQIRATELHECQQELLQANRNYALVQAELDGAQDALRQRDGELQSLHAELDESRAALDQSLDRKQSEVEAELEHLRADARASARAAEELRTENAQIEAMLEQANEQRKDDLEAIAKLRLSLDEAGREKEDVLVSLTELEEHHAQEQAKLREAQSHAQRLSEDKAKLLVQLREAEAIQDDRLRQLSSQLEMVSVELEASQAQLEANTRTSADHAALQEELVRLQARVSALEHEVADRGLTIVKLTKAKETLEDENTNYGIALSAKQLELSMLKRNARIALGEAASTPRADAATKQSGAVDGQLESTEEDAEPVEAMTLQKGPAALKGHRRRTLDPATVIGVGRLRPSRASVTSATASTPKQPAPPHGGSGGIMAPPSSTKPLSRRPSALKASAASSTGPSTSRKVSAATQARINRRQSMTASASNSQASSAASSRAASPVGSTASSRRSSISSQAAGSENEAPSRASASAAVRRRSLAPPPGNSTTRIGARPPQTLAAMPESIGPSVADLSLSLSELQNVSGDASAASKDPRAAGIHRRLSMLPAPPTGDDGTSTPRASRRGADLVSRAATASSTTPPMPERLLLPA
ncbi:uncharacterized protein PFL1_01559 [Pseudozyma flocculosa PF-1]|uniref:uncharacterized protein n=1 Tax=Pseudozyma flocculosa PF-1 TaxID=1277687 RepID=UPI0004560A6F|nr:uncharacterized protein PFL1_01559 [Pseudozyma flocculosa PF-1]EPQ30658.1 hypothetical protein PFL1_01559 [Pseudozyma flocculosa PF-1]